ncbi:MAG: hypothetical protein OXB91_10025, partial [Bryobacterales bacterium]|nr:hypothetical protein [Bryobacterales bacterium]
MDTIARVSEGTGRARSLLPRAVLRGLAACAFAASGAFGQPAGFNYDEAAVPAYELPQILRSADGGSVETAADWPARRAEILQLFEQQVYGAAPAAPTGMAFSVLEEDRAALGGLAHRKQVRVAFGGNPKVSSMEILLYTPTSAGGPVPVFLGLNFGGNHTAHQDPAIRLADRMTAEGLEEASDADRGRSA